MLRLVTGMLALALVAGCEEKYQAPPPPTPELDVVFPSAAPGARGPSPAVPPGSASSAVEAPAPLGIPGIKNPSTVDAGSAEPEGVPL